MEAPSSSLVPDRVVRVTADSLTRLMGLAGEALVQTHRLPSLVESLWRLKGRQTGLLESLQLLEDRLSNRGVTLPAAEQELLARSRARPCRTCSDWERPWRQSKSCARQ